MLLQTTAPRAPDLNSENVINIRSYWYSTSEYVLNTLLFISAWIVQTGNLRRTKTPEKGISVRLRGCQALHTLWPKLIPVHSIRSRITKSSSSWEQETTESKRFPLSTSPRSHFPSFAGLPCVLLFQFPMVPFSHFALPKRKNACRYSFHVPAFFLALVLSDCGRRPHHFGSCDGWIIVTAAIYFRSTIRSTRM